MIREVLKNTGRAVLTALILGEGAMGEQPVAYTNPVIPNGADPYCLRAADGTYYLLTTGLGCFSSSNLVDWTRQKKIKIKDTWGRHDFWAPEFVEYKGRYYLFYCARKEPEGPHFLGVATSDRPEGPYLSEPQPLTDIAPSIDAHVFFDDDGRIYLYWSEKGIGVDHRAINACELNADLMSLKGSPRMLIFATQEWEYGRPWKGKGWNEGPFMLKRNGTYYLMFSANLYTSPFYGVGYAESRSPLGPFKKWEHNPVLSREGFEDSISGPGHHSVVASPDGRELFAVYHKHVAPGSTDREVCIDRMGFRPDGSIYIDGPTTGPQPLPSGVDGRRNIAAEARIKTNAGNQSDLGLLTDGEFSIHGRLGGSEWVGGTSADRPVVRMEWDAPRKITEIDLYDGGNPDRRIEGASVALSDGTVLENIVFPAGPGAAARVVFTPRELDWIAVRIECQSTSEPSALSEIMVWSVP